MTTSSGGSQKGKAGGDQGKVTLWQAGRDVLLAIIEKDLVHALLLMIPIGAIVMFCVLGGSTRDWIARRLMVNLKQHCAWGWSLAGILPILWVAHFRWYRKMAGKEMERLAEGRNEKQIERLGRDRIRSSKKGKKDER